MAPISYDEGDRRQRSRLWPAVILLTVALVLLTGFQTFQLGRDRAALHRLRAGQEPTVQQAVTLRAQLDSIARRTLELAQKGNSGAASIVEELAKRGVTIKPEGASADSVSR